jgi:MFS family permease
LLAVAWISFASGVGQFGVVAALGDVAKTFGHIAAGTTVADQAGLSGTSLGLGLALIRLASLGALPLAALADRVGRRRVLLAVTTAGLAITVLASASPGYWWFVVIFATGRPLLTAANSLCSVLAAEETSSQERAKAMALVAAAYGVGAGATAIIHSLAGSTLGFRGICLLGVVPLATIPFIAGRLEEPDRFRTGSGLMRDSAVVGRNKPAEHVARAPDKAPDKARDKASDQARDKAPDKRKTWMSAIMAATGKPYRKRLAIVALLGFFLSMVTGPANTFVFLFAQNVKHLAGFVTALMVVGAGVTGLLGLLVGRYAADKFGRRPTAMASMMLLAVLATVTYGGSKAGLLIGYVSGVGVASIFAPAAASLINELFPTDVRASVNGWQAASGVIGAAVGLVVFGAVADIGNRFAIAAAVTFLPTVIVALAFWFLPETNRLEPEDLWSTPVPGITP